MFFNCNQKTIAFIINNFMLPTKAHKIYIALTPFSNSVSFDDYFIENN